MGSWMISKIKNQYHDLTVALMKPSYLQEAIEFTFPDLISALDYNHSLNLLGILRKLDGSPPPPIRKTVSSPNRQRKVPHFCLPIIDGRPSLQSCLLTVSHEEFYSSLISDCLTSFHTEKKLPT